MSVAAIIMWWSRRPRGSLGAPDYDREKPVPKGLVMIPIIAGLIFPLVGLSILLVMALDVLLPRLVRVRLN
jgi:uncharacterized iron-regulated membrane protein